jgi:flagellar biosynthesis GTPase FlhF
VAENKLFYAKIKLPGHIQSLMKVIDAESFEDACLKIQRLYGANSIVSPPRIVPNGFFTVSHVQQTRTGGNYEAALAYITEIAAYQDMIIKYVDDWPTNNANSQT